MSCEIVKRIKEDMEKEDLLKYQKNMIKGMMDIILDMNQAINDLQSKTLGAAQTLEALQSYKKR